MAFDPAKPFDLLFEVMPTYDRNRLDLFVKAMIPSMSRTRIQLRISEGRVEVNGECRPSNWRVLAGDAVLIRCKDPDEGGAEAARGIPLEILYEDEDVVVVNKQPGLVVHPVGRHRHDTLLNALYWRYRDVIPEGEGISLANRLDQYTSGVILAAKHSGAKRVLQEDFEARIPRKTYLALCRGMVAMDEGGIELPIGPESGGGNHCNMAVRLDGEGKPSTTLYRVRERFSQGFTLVEVQPITGRQHQIRVHMSALGHPLAGDGRYGGGYRLELEQGIGIERYALHAFSLTYRHPRSGVTMTSEASLAADMAAVLEGLRKGLREVVGGMKAFSKNEFP